eukprot:gb/GECH01004928.1/.p1 GENE.gb/GECH01004928.1/~~gb/GECH01004928.1/.p1  ORF type:complete len:290 (+),score=47.05 gb/GECH01004928.1/:1-870(+)
MKFFFQKSSDNSEEQSSQLENGSELKQNKIVLISKNYKNQEKYFDSISTALVNSNSGDTIRLYPGKYLTKSPLNLQHNISIIGMGNSPQDVILFSQEPRTINCCRTGGVGEVTALLKNLKLEQRGSNNCVVLNGAATVIMENCDITSLRAAGVNAGAQSNLWLFNCKIHHCGQYGLYTYGNNICVMFCEIFENSWCGIDSRDRSGIYMYNDVHHNQRDGVLVTPNQNSIFEHNYIYDNIGTNMTHRNREQSSTSTELMELLYLKNMFHPRIQTSFVEDMDQLFNSELRE